MGGRRYIRGVAPSPSGADPGDAASAGPATEGSGDDPGSAAEDPAPPPDDPSPPPDDGTWDADVVLSDGGTMRVRPIGPDDSALIAAFHERQSPESIYFRYFSPRPRLTGADLERLTQVDRVDRMAFVGIVNGELVGVARYDRHPTRAEAEVAFFTDDAHAGRGVATILLEYLAAWARQVGITGFVAQVLPSNRRMIGVFRQAGFTVESRFADGVIDVDFPIEPTPEARAAMAERARRAEARSVARILTPRSVAVIGASRRPGSLGQAVFRRLLEGGFEGPVYAVNAEADVVASVRAHASILDIPDEIDLAVVVVPADAVPEVVEQCGRKRVQGLVVVSAGFADAGAEGARRERELVAQVRRLGIRLIGPNTMGVVNTAPDVRLVATFADVAARPGAVGVSSQSGTIGAAIVRRLEDQGSGVSSFVATGNKADVSGNDLLRYWETDEATRVIVLYLESFGNPRNFSRIARRVGRSKPIVVVKAGRALAARPPDPGVDGTGDGFAGPTRAGSRSGRDSDRVSDALLAQTGVVRVDTLDQLFDVVRVLDGQPVPAGRRVAVLSNFWGPAVLATDACVAAGLELAEIDEDVERRTRPQLPPGTRFGNPLELTSEGGPRDLAVAARALLGDPGVDALVVVHAQSLDGDAEDMARALADLADGTKPIVASFLGADLAPGAAGAVPVFAFPEAAVHALGRAARYGEWRRRDVGAVPTVDGLDSDQIRARAEAAVEGLEPGERRLLPLAEALDLFAAAGIAPVAQREVGSYEAAVAAADEVGWPVALKAGGVDRPRRTEEGGVAVDVFAAEDLRGSYERMRRHHGAAMDTAVVQAMVPTGVDGAIEVDQDPTLGATIRFGLWGGGPASERILPLTDADAAELIGRGAAAADLAAVPASGRAALTDLLLRVSALADAAPEIASLRLGPVIVAEAQAAITDVAVEVAPWSTDPEIRHIGAPALE